MLAARPLHPRTLLRLSRIIESEADVAEEPERLPRSPLLRQPERSLRSPRRLRLTRSGKLRSREGESVADRAGFTHDTDGGCRGESEPAADGRREQELSGARCRPLTIGLTGGIAAGKSTALAAFERLGAATISSDAVVHELLESEPLRGRLVERWGEEVAPDGSVDRAKVGQIVFADPERAVLARGADPPARRGADRRMAGVAARGAPARRDRDAAALRGGHGRRLRHQCSCRRRRRGASRARRGPRPHPGRRARRAPARPGREGRPRRPRGRERRHVEDLERALSALVAKLRG